jgi:DNA helicase-2/ATP-dependent DNA helicase PcrA
VDDDFIADVKRDVRTAAQALRENRLPVNPSAKTCGQCDYCNLCSASAASQTKTKERG